MKIEVNISKGSVIADFKQRILKGIQTRNLMRKITGDLKSATDKNFERQGRPMRWKALAPITLEAREKMGKLGKMLQVTGHLKNSITERFNNNTSIVGTNLKYARIHQKGGQAGRNLKVKIPARPFIKLLRQEKRVILNRIEKHFK